MHIYMCLGVCENARGVISMAIGNGHAKTRLKTERGRWRNDIHPTYTLQLKRLRKTKFLSFVMATSLGKGITLLKIEIEQSRLCGTVG